MSIVCCSAARRVSSRTLAAMADRAKSAFAHADMLGLLERFAFRRDRWGDDHLDVLELRDIASAADAQGRPQGAGEVLAAIVDACRAVGWDRASPCPSCSPSRPTPRLPPAASRS